MIDDYTKKRKLKCSKCGKICNVSPEEMTKTLYMGYYDDNFLCLECGAEWFKYYSEHLSDYEIKYRLGKIARKEFVEIWRKHLKKFINKVSLILT